jgi:hypothetical protein
LSEEKDKSRWKGSVLAVAAKPPAFCLERQNLEGFTACAKKRDQASLPSVIAKRKTHANPCCSGFVSPAHFANVAACCGCGDGIVSRAQDFILGYFRSDLSKLDICDGRKKTGQYMKRDAWQCRVVGFCFVSGHDFSRAIKEERNLGFSPWNGQYRSKPKGPRAGQEVERRGFYETAAEFKGFLMFFYSWDLLLLRLFLLSLTRS